MNDDRAKALIERYQRDPDFHHRVDVLMNSQTDVGTLREAVDCVEAIRIITNQLEAEQAKRPAFQFVTEDDFTLKLHSDAVDQCCGTCLHWAMNDERCTATDTDAIQRGIRWRFGEGWECPHWRRASTGLIESRRRWHNAEQPGAVACAACDHWRRYGNGFGRCNVHDRDRSAGASCGDWLPVTQAALDDEAKAGR